MSSATWSMEVHSRSGGATAFQCSGRFPLRADWAAQRSRRRRGSFAVSQGNRNPWRSLSTLSRYLPERRKTSSYSPRTSSSFPPAAVKLLRSPRFLPWFPPPFTVRSTTFEDLMENRPLLEGPVDLQRRKNRKSKPLARPQYIELPSTAAIEEPGPGLLLEYSYIVRR